MVPQLAEDGQAFIKPLFGFDVMRVSQHPQSVEQVRPPEAWLRRAGLGYIPGIV